MTDLGLGRGRQLEPSGDQPAEQRQTTGQALRGRRKQASRQRRTGGGRAAHDGGIRREQQVQGAWQAGGVAGPSGTVTFLFTDIEGSTRLWQADEEAMNEPPLPAMTSFGSLSESLTHGGAVFSTMGDGVAAVFVSATAAVASALAAQERVGAEEWPTARPIRVRMGLHTGEAGSATATTSAQP